MSSANEAKVIMKDLTKCAYGKIDFDEFLQYADNIKM